MMATGGSVVKRNYHRAAWHPLDGRQMSGESQEMESSTLAERLRRALDACRGLSQGAFELEAGWPNGYATRVLKGERRRLGSDMIGRAAQVLGVDPEWLGRGVGEMDRTKSGSRVLGGPIDFAIGFHADEPNRWSEATIAAARSMSKTLKLTAPQWVTKLDDIELRLGGADATPALTEHEKAVAYETELIEEIESEKSPSSEKQSDPPRIVGGKREPAARRRG